MKRGPAWLVFATVVGLAGGCELLVPGAISEVHCTDEGAIGPPACPTGSFCDEGLCRDGPPALGMPCTEGRMCAPGDRCVESAALGIEGAGLCSRPCCSSADCAPGDDLVCAPVGPGKMCVPAGRWGRGATGEGLGGEGCSSDADCLSGTCTDGGDGGGFCLDTCCSDAECNLFGAACHMAEVGWSCLPKIGPQKPYTVGCEADAECTSGFCAEWSDGEKRCSEPCCSSTACGKIKIVDDVRPVMCVPVQRGTAIVHACAALGQMAASRGLGEPCDEAAQCRGGRCIAAGPSTGDGPPAKVCSDVCCTDASCGAPALFACTPANDDAAQDEPPGPDGQGFGLQCTRR